MMLNDKHSDDADQMHPIAFNGNNPIYPLSCSINDNDSNNYPANVITLT